MRKADLEGPTTAENNYPEMSQGFHAAMRDMELARRAQLIRKAKEAVGGRPLTGEELDRLIPPMDCYWTRRRLNKLRG
ncbi:MAG TPA: hypothetical protein VG125_26425 [Pirellulales bacterium]|jgi:hypothetical protein|nr:hypothetical protein [Pirellulales bacterium]